MGVHQVTPFIPKTNNVNGDRRYYIDGLQFIKADENFSRGRHEADMLTLLQDAWYVPTLRAVFTQPGYHCIRMDKVPGDTLENLKSTLTQAQKRIVVESLLRIVEDLLYRGLVHGDVNESNIIFDPISQHVWLIDWEMGRKEDSLQDVYGPPWGLLDLLGKIQ